MDDLSNPNKSFVKCVFSNQHFNVEYYVLPEKVSVLQRLSALFVTVVWTSIVRVKCCEGWSRKADHCPLLPLLPELIPLSLASSRLLQQRTDCGCNPYWILSKQSVPGAGARRRDDKWWFIIPALNICMVISAPVCRQECLRESLQWKYCHSPSISWL